MDIFFFPKPPARYFMYHHIPCCIGSFFVACCLFHSIGWKWTGNHGLPKSTSNSQLNQLWHYRYPPVVQHGWKIMENPRTKWRYKPRKIIHLYTIWLFKIAMEAITMLLRTVNHLFRLGPSIPWLC